MKINIIGDGAFGSFLKEALIGNQFESYLDSETVVLAVPLSAYDEVASKHAGKHLVNVCSIQMESTDICMKYSDRVTSIHPLFGRRTPKEKRSSILTYSYTRDNPDNDTWFSEPDLSQEFIARFVVATGSQLVLHDIFKKYYTPVTHDMLMAKTHVAAVMAAKQLKVYTDRVDDVPDNHLPNSFRLMRDFVKTLEDMPKGTLDSILSNKFN